MQAVLSVNAPAFTPGVPRLSAPAPPTLKTEQPPTGNLIAAQQAPSHRRGMETNQSSLALEGVPHAGLETTASARLHSVSHADHQIHALVFLRCLISHCGGSSDLCTIIDIGLLISFLSRADVHAYLQQVEREQATLSGQTRSPRSSGASSLLNQAEHLRQQGGGDIQPEEDATAQVGSGTHLAFIYHEPSLPWPKQATASAPF